MKNLKVLLFLALLFFLYLPRFLSLDAHWNSDEAIWLARSSNFISAIKTGQFSETLVAYHPGVMTMWSAGIRTFYMDFQLTVENLIHARFFIGLTVLTGLLIACFLLNRLLGQWIALTGLVCLAYSPLFLAQTRRVHTDALAATFILLTVLLFILYCQNRHRQHYLIFSGIAFGLAVLSKSYALTLLLWFPVCMFLFREKRSLDTHIASGIYFLNCTILTIFGLWPVFWTPIFAMMALCLGGLTFLIFRELKTERCPLWLVGVTAIAVCLGGFRAVQHVWLVFEKLNWAVTTPHEVEHFFLGKVVNDPGWLFYPFVLTIKSTPLMLPLAIVGCILLWKNRKQTEESKAFFRIALSLVICIALFTICFSATSKKFSRYLLPTFLMLEILSAIGFVEVLKWGYNSLRSHFGSLQTEKYKTTFAVFTCTVFLIIQVVPVLTRHPYYGTYYNPCWKVTDITKIITIGDASGMDIAANYLNQKTEPRRMVVQVSPLSTHFLRRYFPGRIYGAGRSLPGNPKTDYEVVYIRDSQIGKVPQTGTLNGELEAVITLNGIDHVWIYRIPAEEE